VWKKAAKWGVSASSFVINSANTIYGKVDNLIRGMGSGLLQRPPVGPSANTDLIQPLLKSIGGAVQTLGAGVQQIQETAEEPAATPEQPPVQEAPTSPSHVPTLNNRQTTGREAASR
jgi:hypothetical protein